VVLTTYGIVSSEFELLKEDVIQKNNSKSTLKNKKKHFNKLHKINWFRIVVDEADNIKNKNTKNSKSVIELNGVMKWVLTGTPIQNKMEDMFPYLSFLNFEPFDN